MSGGAKPTVADCETMPLPRSEIPRARLPGYFLSYLLARGMIGLFRLLPYRWRVPATGKLAAHVLAPLAGFRKRIRDNLALVMPDMDATEVRRMCIGVADNAGRVMMELFSTEDLKARARRAPLVGPGLAALREARAEGRPIILVTAHFGNYDAARARLAAEGYVSGGLYRRMANPYFNDFYVAHMRAIGGPMFEQGRRGMTELVRHLRRGGIVGILNDLHAHGGANLTFFGKPAVTSLITAELALKYDALLLPVYGIRQPDGLDFEVRVHAPIPHSDPVTMTQAINDDLEAIVREHMPQWFWIHRRWKTWPYPARHAQANRAGGT